jgi:sugar phosphate isomerase/epimerase
MNRATTPLSFAHLGALEVGPPDLIDLAADAGFASTSLRMIQTVPGSPVYPMADRHLRRATAERMRATGVGLLYIEVLSLHRGLDVAALEPIFAAGAELGATRVLAAGDDADFDVVADKLAASCELARGYGLAIDVEFMPFRAVRSLADALDVIARAGAPNAHVLVDVLHFWRSASSLEQLGAMDRRLYGTFQICDAPARPPADLAHEARHARLLPGHGTLDIAALLRHLPDDVPIGVEVPMGLSHPELDHRQRARRMLDETRRTLAKLA